MSIYSNNGVHAYYVRDKLGGEETHPEPVYVPRSDSLATWCEDSVDYLHEEIRKLKETFLSESFIEEKLTNFRSEVDRATATLNEFASKVQTGVQEEVERCKLELIHDVNGAKSVATTELKDLATSVRTETETLLGKFASGITIRFNEDLGKLNDDKHAVLGAVGTALENLQKAEQIHNAAQHVGTESATKLNAELTRALDRLAHEKTAATHAVTTVHKGALVSIADTVQQEVNKATAPVRAEISDMRKSLEDDRNAFQQQAEEVRRLLEDVRRTLGQLEQKSRDLAGEQQRATENVQVLESRANALENALSKNVERAALEEQINNIKGDLDTHFRLFHFEHCTRLLDNDLVWDGESHVKLGDYVNRLVERVQKVISVVYSGSKLKLPPRVEVEFPCENKGVFNLDYEWVDDNPLWKVFSELDETLMNFEPDGRHPPDEVPEDTYRVHFDLDTHVVTVGEERVLFAYLIEELNKWKKKLQDAKKSNFMSIQHNLKEGGDAGWLKFLG